jgi:hypothetical protein
VNNRPEYLTPERQQFKIANSTTFNNELLQINKNDTHVQGTQYIDPGFSYNIPSLYDKTIMKPLESFKGYTVKLCV